MASTVRFDRRTRSRVVAASDGGPTLGAWLDRIRAIDNPNLTTAIDGIWCGHSGRETLDMTGATSMLCVGWYNGRVEFSYIS